jgi:hypothetical protein
MEKVDIFPQNEKKSETVLSVAFGEMLETNTVRSSGAG